MITIYKALSELTEISDNQFDNDDNFIASLPYLDNIYRVFDAVRKTIPDDEVRFLPSFKGMYIVERLGILSTAEENELRYFRIASPLFLEDGIVDRLKGNMGDADCDVRKEDEAIVGVILR